MPEGISQKHFEQKQQELEQFLNSKIEFGFNKELVIKLISMNLSTQYDYVFEEQDSPLKAFVGWTHSGKFIFDIEKACQTIVAGEPNSGKSSFLRSLILSLILSKYDVDLHLIDFQDIELPVFENAKKVKSYGSKPEEFEALLNEMAEESQRRSKLFRSVKSKMIVQKLDVWNKNFPEQYLPPKVIVIDEFAKLAEKNFRLCWKSSAQE
jgi:DNA segregation ATPase FtsK/SpoIIIE-like protein